MIRTILFDLDNTLLDFNRAEREALSATFQQLGIAISEATISRYNELNLYHWKQLERGLLTRDQVMLFRFQRLFEEIGAPCSAAGVSENYEKHLANSECHFIEGAEEIVAELSKNYILCIATNGPTEVQKSRIKRSGLEPYFKHIFISQEMGVNKPHREFFDLCLSRIPNSQKEETLIIGDSLSSDIQGGINADIKTMWFNPSGTENDSSIQPDYEIKKLKDIIALL